MKLFILGVDNQGNGGQLARALWREFQVSGLHGDSVRGISRAEMDIWHDRERLAELIRVQRPEVVINATAFTRVDDAERPEFCAEAMQVNGYALELLAVVCKEAEALLVHYSTDYVAAGGSPAGLREDDDCSPRTVYGQSKLLGEQIIQRVGGRYYILRTSWLYGPGGKNFVNTMLELGKSRSEITVVSDQFGVPNYTIDLARATREIIEHQLPSGIYHPVADDSCSWAEFAREIFQRMNMSVVVHDQTTAEWLAKQHAAGKIVAQRPQYSMLLNTKISSDIFHRSWRDALGEYLVTISS